MERIRKFSRMYGPGSPDAQAKPPDVDAPSEMHEQLMQYGERRAGRKAKPPVNEEFPYPKIGDTAEILRGGFMFVRDSFRLLAPWKLAKLVGYYRKLGNEVETTDIKFPSGEMEVTGVLCRPKTDVKLPTLVLSMGIDRKAEEFKPFIELIARQGYNVYAPDSRTSMGDEPVESIAKADISDLVNAVKHMHEKDWFNGRYAMAGASIGAARTLIAAARMAEDPEFTGKDGYKQPNALVSMGSYADMAEEYHYLKWLIDSGKETPEFARKWIPACLKEHFTPEERPEEFKDRSPMQHIQKIPSTTPVFIGHGLTDRVIPHKQADKLYNARPGNTQLGKEGGGGIHTVMDVLADINPYRLKPVEFMKKFLSDIWTGHKSLRNALWYLVDDLNDIAGLGLTVYALGGFLDKNLEKG